ncbi:McrB family protein [Brevundimonas diminuta]|uniref:McrB family protein n=1 Tax=Brevundimonas diminuta TaxID=293 RepID=UPI001F57E557|nr:AAA family ATPase [Brevundimonas diminuta]
MTIEPSAAAAEDAHLADDSGRLGELRAAWGVAAGAPIVVVGRLLRREAHNASFYLLEDLEHPVSGVGLAYPTQESPASAYVAPTTAKRVLEQTDRHGETVWALAELVLSPAEERRKRRNPHGCMVRPGTLRLLEEIPPDWGANVGSGEPIRLLAASAREALERHALSRLAEADEALAAVRAARDNQQRLLEEGTRALASLADTISEKDEQLDDLHETIALETRTMEERFGRLSDLLSRRGDRLVALGLIDQDDLEALQPGTVPAVVSSESRFSGDYSELAPLLQAKLRDDGMLFAQAQLRDFVALLRTHDLVVLAGDSGTGKTSLVRTVAAAIGARCSIIPVKPNWSGPEDLLGYYNPLQRSYHSTPFLQALQRAEAEPDRLHFICLDEMNLARVEYYFADFLSLLEKRSELPIIPIHTADEERHTLVDNGLFLVLEAEARRRAGLADNATLEDLLRDETANRILHQLGGFTDAESVLSHHGRLRRALTASIRTPTELKFPENVRIFGAINVDETTHYLSAKVLDRVHVMRFTNPSLTDWDALEAEADAYPEAERSPSLRLEPEQLGVRSDYPAFDRRKPETAFLLKLVRDYLDPLGVEFGLRALRQSLGYLEAATLAGIDPQTARNNVMLHKVLPKLTMDTSRIGANGLSRREILVSLRDYLDTGIDRAKLSPGADDCVAMLDRLIAAAEGNNGIASYWLR